MTATTQNGVEDDKTVTLQISSSDQVKESIKDFAEETDLKLESKADINEAEKINEENDASLNKKSEIAAEATSIEKLSDKPAGKYEIVKVEIKHGPLRKAVPKMPLPLAYVCCIFNIIIPSSGTLISAFSVFCCGMTEHENILHGFGYNILAAFLQIVSLTFLIGWIWSIMWGILFIKLALKESKMEKPLGDQV